MSETQAMAINDDSFEIAHELLDFQPNDENANSIKWVEKLAHIRQRLTERCRQLADSLDAIVAKHAEEMELLNQDHKQQLVHFEQQKSQFMATLAALSNENEMKTTACQNLLELLKGIHERKCIDTMR